MTLESVAVVAVIAFFVAVLTFVMVLYHDVQIEREKRQKRENEFKNQIVNEVCSYFEQTK